MLGLGTMQGVQAQIAPQISGATQVQSNQVETYYSDYFCDDVPKRYSVNWGVSGGTILAQTELYVTVRWNANVSNGIVNMSVTGSCASAFQSCCASLAINIQPTTVTISGYVTNNCGRGLLGVSINFNGLGGFASYSATTDNSGFYSITVPYGYSSTINATKVNVQFSSGQSFVNTTADRTVNFFVVGDANIAPFIAWRPEPNNQPSLYADMGGLVPGFDYIFYKTNTIGVTTTFEIEAVATGQSIQINQADFPKVCIQRKCSSQTPRCTQ